MNAQTLIDDYGAIGITFSIKGDEVIAQGNKGNLTPERLEQLRAEKQGILTWLVQGCLEWQKRGLTPVPEFIRAATGEYRMETDTFLSFLND